MVGNGVGHKGLNDRKRAGKQSHQNGRIKRNRANQVGLLKESHQAVMKNALPVPETKATYM